MSVIQGKNVVFSLAGWFSGTLFSERVIACGRSCTLTTTTSLIETTTKGTGKGATYRPQKNVTTGTIEGVIFINEKNKVTIPSLRQLQLNQTLQHGIYERIADDGSTYKDIFDFYITNITDSGSVGDFNTFQMDIQVNGDPRIIVEEVSTGGVVVTDKKVEWKASTLEPIINDLLDNSVFPNSQPFTLTKPIEIPMTGIPSNRWLLVRFPIEQATPTTWFNTVMNNGTVPDSVFLPVITTAKWKYLKTRMEVTFDTSATLKFT